MKEKKDFKDQLKWGDLLLWHMNLVYTKMNINIRNSIRKDQLLNYIQRTCLYSKNGNSTIETPFWEDPDTYRHQPLDIMMNAGVLDALKSIKGSWNPMNYSLFQSSIIIKQRDLIILEDILTSMHTNREKVK